MDGVGRVLSTRTTAANPMPVSTLVQPASRGQAVLAATSRANDRDGNLLGRVHNALSSILEQEGDRRSLEV